MSWMMVILIDGVTPLGLPQVVSLPFCPPPATILPQTTVLFTNMHLSVQFFQTLLSPYTSGTGCVWHVYCMEIFLAFPVDYPLDK